MEPVWIRHWTHRHVHRHTNTLPYTSLAHAHRGIIIDNCWLLRACFNFIHAVKIATCCSWLRITLLWTLWNTTFMWGLMEWTSRSFYLVVASPRIKSTHRFVLCMKGAYTCVRHCALCDRWYILSLYHRNWIDSTYLTINILHMLNCMFFAIELKCFSNECCLLMPLAMFLLSLKSIRVL